MPAGHRVAVGHRLGFTAMALALAACAAAPTRVDEDPATGFALYRSGQLDRDGLVRLCRLGVEEIVVLDGNAGSRECRLRREVCPDLRVRYNAPQDAHTPVTADFLAAFDAWVEEARHEGRRVAFRCRRGWHRAGRLTAWYRMRFQHRPAAQAIAEMNRVGRFMWHHRQLAPQVEAMADHLAGRPCSTAPEHCVGAGANPGAPPPGFPPDACP